MSGKKIIYPIIFLAVMMSNLYYIWDTERRSNATHQYEYQLVEVALSVKEQVERKLKEIKYIISNSEDREKLELAAENLELKWQNEKLIRDLLIMFNLLKGREMPLNRPSGRTNI